MRQIRMGELSNDDKDAQLNTKDLPLPILAEDDLEINKTFDGNKLYMQDYPHGSKGS
jgi:hypothetical protein